MLGLGDELLRQGVKVYDICMWKGTNDNDLHREAREIHYPESVVDVLHPYILLCHQGMVESMFINDLAARGVSITRDHIFETYEQDQEGILRISAATFYAGTQSVRSKYLVGCDGARSAVRKAMPGTHSQGSPHNSVWGVLDGELDTDFPDIWSKTLVYSEQHGSLLMIPRERNMTRLYIEMKNWESSKGLGQEFVMEQARNVLQPYRINWKSVEWFGNYAVSQRVAARFSDPQLRAFIAGDASHSHSPKAAQGLNTSVHDSWNLGWKLNLSLRGLSLNNTLLETYEDERRKIAHDLINFDFEHANQVAGGNAKQLAENFRTNTRFISGVGVEYGPNALNYGQPVGALRPGCRLPPAKVTRFIDANPVDVQMDIPMLGQFRVYVLAPDLQQCSAFLFELNQILSQETSPLSKISRAAADSYSRKPRDYGLRDLYQYPERYTSASQLFTYALISE